MIQKKIDKQWNIGGKAAVIVFYAGNKSVGKDVNVEKVLIHEYLISSPDFQDFNQVHVEVICSNYLARSNTTSTYFKATKLKW